MSRNFRHLTVRFAFLFVLPVITVIAGAHYWVKATRYITTENAYVKAHHLAISADIDGRAIRVMVKENDRV